MIKHNIISFDFDGTLNNFFDGTHNPHKLEVRDWVRRFKRRGYDVHIITRRYGPDNSVLGAMDEHVKVLKLAKELGITEDKVIFTNREWKHSFVKQIKACIHIDDEENERVLMEQHHPHAKVIWLGEDNWNENLISELESHDGLQVWLSNEDNFVKIGIVLIIALLSFFIAS